MSLLAEAEADRSTCPVDLTVPVETTAVLSVPSITSRQLARLAELEAKEQERELEVDDQADAVHSFLSQLDADVLASMAQDAMQRIKEACGAKRKISQRRDSNKGQLAPSLLGSCPSQAMNSDLIGMLEEVDVSNEMIAFLRQSGVKSVTDCAVSKSAPKVYPSFCL